MSHFIVGLLAGGWIGFVAGAVSAICWVGRAAARGDGEQA